MGVIRKEIVTKHDGVIRVFSSITEFAAEIGRSNAYISDRIPEGKVPDGNGDFYTIVDVREHVYQGNQFYEKSDQACWTCVYASGGCEWTDSKCTKPVPGWNAQPTYKSGILWSYKIYDCPKYKRG